MMGDAPGRAEFDENEENSEQQEGDQAQDVASDALDDDADEFEESERGGSSNPAAIIPEDVPDLIDKMNEMVTSGRIDTDAFFGEPVHDDEEGVLGDTDQDD